MAYNGPFPQVVKSGGTGDATLTAHSVLIGEGTSAVAFVGPVASTGCVLQSNGVGSDPGFSTATYPTTTTVSQILYSSSANVVGGLSTANDGLLVTSNTGVPSILAGPGTTGNILQANASAAPSFSTTTYPSTNAINTIMYASSANVLGVIAASNNGVLISSTSGVPSWLAAGTTGQVLAATTSAAPSWKTSTTGTFSVVTQVFTGNGTYTPTSGMVYCITECVGGGGAGGGSASSSASSYASGGGGGGGGYSRKTSTAAAIGVSQTVTIGAGGTAGSAGNNPGNNGGDTSLGAICIAKGGTGGGGSTAAGFGAGGAGGVAGTGEFTFPGGTGNASLWQTTGSTLGMASAGGLSHFGAGAPSREGNGANHTGLTAGNYGGGGGGGISYNASGTVAGGAGGPGVLIITEYVFT